MDDPKIVLLDLEIIPNLKEALKVWPRISQWPGKTLRASITSIICGGYKIYGESKTHCLNAWDYSRWKRDINDDYSICRDLYNVLKDADAIVGHNLKGFDFRYLQTRLIKNKIGPLGNITTICTKEVAKRNLFVFDNKLDTLSEFLLDERKLDHEGWDLWVKVYNKDKDAMKLMTKYCVQDVDLLEKNFVKLKPLIKNIPNYNLWIKDGRHVCPNCGSTRLNSNGYRHTQTRSYKRLICVDCNAWSRVDARDRNPRSI